MWWKDTWCWLWLLCLLKAKYSLLPYLVTLWLKYLFIMSKSQFSGGNAAPSLWGDPSFKPSPKWTNCYERWIKITLALWVEGDSSGHAGGHMDGMHSSVWMVRLTLQGCRGHCSHCTCARWHVLKHHPQSYGNGVSRTASYTGLCLEHSTVQRKQQEAESFYPLVSVFILCVHLETSPETCFPQLEPRQQE